MAGSGGVNSWPDYMQEMHWSWLNYGKDLTTESNRGQTFNVDEDIAAARGRNPFAGVSAYDPSAEIESVLAEITGYDTDIEAMNEITDWKRAVLAARAEIFDGIPDAGKVPVVPRVIISPIADVEIDDIIGNAVESHERRSRPQFLRGVGRFAAGISETGQHRGSALTLGLALLEIEHRNSVLNFQDDLYGRKAILEGQHRSQAALQEHSAEVQEALTHRAATVEGDRLEYQTAVAISEANAKLESGFMVQGITDILKIMTFKLQSKADFVRLISEANKLKITALAEQKDKDVMFESKEVTWNLDQYAYAGNLLAAQSGGVYRTAGDLSGLSEILAKGGALAGIASFIGNETGLSDWFKGLGSDDKWLS